MRLRPNLTGALRVNGTSRKEICCNQIGVRQTDTNEVGKHFFQAKTLVKETDAKEILARL